MSFRGKYSFENKDRKVISFVLVLFVLVGDVTSSNKLKMLSTAPNRLV